MSGGLPFAGCDGAVLISGFSAVVCIINVPSRGCAIYAGLPVNDLLAPLIGNLNCGRNNGGKDNGAAQNP